MPGVLAILWKRPSPSLRAYAVVQVFSCCYYGLYESTGSEVEYRIGYVLFTVLATTLAGWEVARLYASKLTLLVGLGLGVFAFAILPANGQDERILLIQACGSLAVGIPLVLSLPWNPDKLIPATVGALFLGVAAFWFSYVLEPGWRDHWDWIAPVWMHTAAYSWLAWKLPWSSEVARVKV